MVNALVAIHLIIAVVMVGFILLQKSEGSAGAGVGGSVSVESMMRPRSRPNPLSRATSILGFAFFATSLGLALVGRPAHLNTSIMEEPVSGVPSVPKLNDTPAASPAAPAAPAAPSVPTVPNN
jgi:preprotein translocase subunit SecG